MFQRIVADGIELRQFAQADAAIVFQTVERNRDYLREWLPWVDLTYAVSDIEEFIQRALDQFEDSLGPNTGIWLDGVFAGAIGCHVFDRNNQSCSLGYWIAAGCQGKGTITRCAMNMLDYLFDEAGLHRVEIRCGTGNLRSCAIPRRLGFIREGVLREAQWVSGRWVDLEVWSMLRQNWRTAV